MVMAAIEPAPVTSVDDYPAAHSADTEWFAVDAEGHVASFWSDETGPVPKAYSDWSRVEQVFSEAGQAESYEESRSHLFDSASRYLLKHLKSTGTSSRSVFDLEGALHLLNDRWLGANRISQGHREYPVWEIRRKRLGCALLIVRSLSVVREAIKNGEAKPALQRPPGPPFAVEFANLPHEVAEHVLRSGECLACASLRTDPLTAAGIFSYSYTGESYGRDTAPAEPILVQQLSPTVRAIVERVRFEALSFANVPYVQPVRFFECSGTEQWESYIDVDGRTQVAVTGRLPTNLASLQQARDEAVRSLEQEREEMVRALARWPRHVRVLPPPGASRWLSHLITQMEDYREAHPSDIVPDLVRVQFTFPDDEHALAVCGVLAGESSIGRQIFRGRSLICHDASEDRLHGAVHDHAPEPVYKWLDERIRAGRLPEPDLSLGRPRCRPSGEELQRLWDELGELRERHAAIVDSHIPTRKERRQLESGPQRDVWETLVALVLRCIGRDFDALPDYYCYLDGYDVSAMPMRRLGELTPLLKEATVDDWRLLERLVTFLPLAPALQRLRLQVLSILAVEGDLSPELLRSSLRAIFEERDEDLCDPYEVLHWAFELPGLPVDELRMTMRQESACEMASIPDDLEQLSEAGPIEGPAYRIFQDLLDRLDQGDYPAAHSMDTWWYAVDQDGHVGRFFSWENGQVPVAAIGELDGIVSDLGPKAWALTKDETESLQSGHVLIWDERRDFLIRQLTVGLCDVVFDRLGKDQPRHLTDASRLRDAPVLFWLDEKTASREVLASWVLAVPSKPDVIVTDGVDPGQFQRLHADGICRGCFAGTSQTLGLFDFEHNDHLNGPYECSGCPDCSIVASQIREPFRRIFELVRFDHVCFGNEATVQPLEFVPCMGYGLNAPKNHLWWVAYCDGETRTIRPIRGKEAEFRARYDDLRRWADEDAETIREDIREEERWRVESLDDYPAAHSMDTTWFAVDGQGQVACFESFDTGVVPATWLYMPTVLWRQIQRDGWACTNCGKKHKNYRLSLGPQSCVICRECNRPQKQPR